jgi:hypothetical protein
MRERLVVGTGARKGRCEMKKIRKWILRYRARRLMGKNPGYVERNREMNREVNREAKKLFGFPVELDENMPIDEIKLVYSNGKQWHINNIGGND